MNGASYSPHDSYRGPPRGDRSSLPPADFPHGSPHGPPLVPMPQRDTRDPGYEQPYHPYDRAAPYERQPYDGGRGYDARPHYPDESGYYASRQPIPEDPYGHYPPRRDYPPPHDYYSRPPPPPQDYYSRPPASSYPPRDPYGYPARDSYASYPPPPPRDPYYHEPHPRDPYSMGPPAPAPPPSAPPAAPAPSFGPPPDPNDLAIPLLYLARSVNSKTFNPLRAKYGNLDLRFVNSLRDLAGDLHAVTLDHPNLLGHRRRVWVTAVGGTDALVHHVRSSLTETLDWREVGDISELERELATEDRRVIFVKEENTEKERKKDREDSEKEEREKQEAEMERGRREIEERERDGAAQGQSAPQDLDEVLRQVMGDSSTSPVAMGVEDATSSFPLPKDIPEQTPSRIDTRHPGDGAALVDRFEDFARRGDELQSVGSESPGRSRKRSRRESELEEDSDRGARRPQRKKLEAACKLEKRCCFDWAAENSLPVTEETRLVDDEPQLGERHEGGWNVFGEPLEELSPQIQVLMARAMRDATYPPRLRLYDHPDALEQLQSAVPWFVAILNLIKDRYELADSSSVIPQDPPSIEHPFFTMPESSRTIPTLSTLSTLAASDSSSATVAASPAEAASAPASTEAAPESTAQLPAVEEKMEDETVSVA
ncbi:hypothetical protein JCM11641_003805 [Rhodosporidiobolus odoratus]